jgi:hypothetical protein
MTPVSIEQLKATLPKKSIRTQKQPDTKNWTAVSNTIVQTNVDTKINMKILILCLQTTERRMEYTPRAKNILWTEIAKAQNKDQKLRSIVKKHAKAPKKDLCFQLIEGIIG